MPNLGNKGERKRATKSRAQKIKSSKKLVEDLEDTEEITTPIENESVEDTKPDKVVVKPFSDGLVNKAFSVDVIVNDATCYTSRYSLVKGFFSFMKGSLYVGTIDTRHSSVTNSRRGRLV